MKKLKDENGMTRVRLTVTVLIIMVLVAISIVLALGEDGISFKIDRKNNTNVITNQKVDNNVN